MTQSLASTEQQTAATRALSLSTVAFGVCFAVWTIFSIIGIQIKNDLGLSEAEFGILIGTPVLTGSLVRLVLGIWTDRFGGRVVYTVTMLASALAAFLLSLAQTYPMMLAAALGVGLAGGSFAVGVAYVSRFYPAEKQGTALGVFGVGNVGAAVTTFLAPFVLVALGWQAVAQIWAVVLVAMAGVFWFLADDDPVIKERRTTGGKGRSFKEEFAPLKNVQVWRFSLYYFFAFGAFVALSLWLPRYLIEVYGFDIKMAGMVAVFYTVPASVFRALGGHFSDRYGARTVMYWMLSVSAAVTLILSIPQTTVMMAGVEGPISFEIAVGAVVFVALIFVLGFFMSLGKAAVYKHIPAYYPESVGAVGGMVGMIGGLGGFILPILFGVLNDITGVWTSCFMLLFVIGVGSLAWMHIAVRKIEGGDADGVPAPAQ